MLVLAGVVACGGETPAPVAVAEIFLAQCLGGPYQPIGEDLEGSSITVPVGKDRIWSLDEALP